MALEHYQQSSSSSSGQACFSCGCGSVSVSGSCRARWKAIGIIAFYYGVRLIARALSTALTLLFAIGGALAGGIAGAFALDALRGYWLSECPGSHSSSSMADLLQELVHGRFVNGQIEQPPPRTSRAYDLQQVNRSNISYGQSSASPGEVASSGLSADSLKKLPSHVLLDEMKAAQEACCTICLQDIGVGDTARSLPQCHHIFHLACVDQWLVMHSSCPVCRTDV